MNKQAARAIAEAIHSSLFDYHGYRTVSRERAADQQCAGRTHYFSDATRAYFRSRVLRLRTECDGLILGAIESTAGDMQNTFRVYRPVFIAIDGFVLDRPNLEDAARNAAGAEKQYAAILATLDSDSVGRAILERAESNARRTLERIKAARRAMRAKA